MRQIILIGDSLTQQGYASGWVSLLSDSFIRVADVVNRGLSGYNTKWILENLRSKDPFVSVPSTPPLFVTLFLGANDAADASSYQHVPLENFQRNLSDIVLWIRAHLAPTHGVVLVAPPPIDAPEWARACSAKYGTDPLVSNRCNDRVRPYRTAVASVAASLDCALLDPFTFFDIKDNDSGSWRELYCDGLHFNERGGALFGQKLIQLVDERLNLRPSDIPMPMPLHLSFAPK